MPAVAFFHIPLKQYETARLAGRFAGAGNEEVLCWGDDGSILKRFKQAGTIRACFTAHSHRNDFYFEDDGITLAYGRATGHGGYGDDLPKGAKLIVLDGNTGQISFQTVFADGRTWQP